MTSSRVRTFWLRWLDTDILRESQLEDPVDPDDGRSDGPWDSLLLTLLWWPGDGLLDALRVQAKRLLLRRALPEVALAAEVAPAAAVVGGTRGDRIAEALVAILA